MCRAPLFALPTDQEPSDLIIEFSPILNATPGDYYTAFMPVYDNIHYVGTELCRWMVLENTNERMKIQVFVFFEHQKELVPENEYLNEDMILDIPKGMVLSYTACAFDRHDYDDGERPSLEPSPNFVLPTLSPKDAFRGWAVSKILVDFDEFKGCAFDICCKVGFNLEGYAVEQFTVLFLDQDATGITVRDVNPYIRELKRFHFVDANPHNDTIHIDNWEWLQNVKYIYDEECPEIYESEDSDGEME